MYSRIVFLLVVMSIETKIMFRIINYYLGWDDKFSLKG